MTANRPLIARGWGLKEKLTTKRRINLYGSNNAYQKLQKQLLKQTDFM